MSPLSHAAFFREEFVAMQVDLIPVVISILKELDVYRGQITYEDD
jgi:hypothetical protein